MSSRNARDRQLRRGLSAANSTEPPIGVEEALMGTLTLSWKEEGQKLRGIDLVRNLGSEGDR